MVCLEISNRISFLMLQQQRGSVKKEREDFSVHRFRVSNRIYLYSDAESFINISLLLMLVFYFDRVRCEHVCMHTLFKALTLGVQLKRKRKRDHFLFNIV